MTYSIGLAQPCEEEIEWKRVAKLLGRTHFNPYHFVSTPDRVNPHFLIKNIKDTTIEVFQGTYEEAHKLVEARNKKIDKEKFPAKKCPDCEYVMEGEIDYYHECDV